MSVFLFLWSANPAAWPNRENDLAQVQGNGTITIPWSVGARRQISAELNQGLEVMAILFRSGRNRDQHGIIGWGQIHDPPFEARDWDPARAQQGHMKWYVNIKFEDLSRDVIIGRDVLQGIAPGTFMTLPMDSGRKIADADAEAVWDILENL